jgi:hypothetical protein
MATGQASNVVVVFESVNADGAGIARSAHHLWGGGGPDRVVIVLILCQ